MTTLNEELAKPQYSNLSAKECFDIVKGLTTSRVGKIAYGDTLELVSILARGLRKRIAECVVPELKIAWEEALQPAYLASPSYSINVSLLEIRAMLDAGLAVGICTQNEYNKIVQLATKETPTYPDVLLKDIIAIKQPDLTNVGEWEILQYTGSKLVLTLTQSLPEKSLIRIEASESVDGINWTKFQRIGHFYDVDVAGTYTANIPFSQMQRKLQWRGEFYAVVGSVVGV